jgi:alkylation response protein AidB-like acyl-CoA dehydrogenase
LAFQNDLRRVVDDVVAPGAEATDRTGEFPRDAVRALGAAGVTGLTVAAELGGAGEGLRAAASVVRQLSTACGSTAMVMLMHYSATAGLTACNRTEVLREIGVGQHLTTLAFSETGSRSHFWAPQGTASVDDGMVVLNARKSWVTSAAYADSYVWSSRPLAADGDMTLWLVRTGLPGLSVSDRFDGLGLRGNGSVPVSADGVRVAPEAMLGDDGQGLRIALEVILPWFLVLNAAASVGLMEGVTAEAASHLRRTQLTHLGRSLAEQPVPRATLARMQIELDRSRALLDDTITAVEQGTSNAQLQVLEVKAAAGDSAALVADLGMQVCGGAAFRRELALERRFRDSRAARVMAPTSDALHDFVGRAVCELPLFGEVKQ